MQLACDLLPVSCCLEPLTAVSAAIWISEGTYKRDWGKAETAEAEGLESPDRNLFAAQELEMHKFGNKTARLHCREPPLLFPSRAQSGGFNSVLTSHLFW